MSFEDRIHQKADGAASRAVLVLEEFLFPDTYAGDTLSLILCLAVPSAKRYSTGTGLQMRTL